MREDAVKSAIIDLMKEEPLPVLQIAYIYAKHFIMYGEDITKTWDTAIENVNMLEKAYRKGYYDALERSES